MTYGTFDGTSQEEPIVNGRFSSDGSQYLADSEKINLGTDEDFQIYHDGANGYITNTKGEFQIGNSGTGNTIFIQPKIGENAIKQSIKNLLMTDTYEKPFEPQFGSGLQNILFEPITPTSAFTLKTLIEDTLNKY